MRVFFSDKVNDMEKKINPWIAGFKPNENGYDTIFKDDTPLEIKELNKEYLELLKKEFEAAGM